jgi:hypothetical protein
VTSVLGPALLGLLAGGCLLSDPATYDEPTQTTPVIDAHTADPAPTRILAVSSGDQRAITVDFRSEDQGEDVLAILFLNYASGEGGIYQTGTQIAASTWDDTDRSISMSWRVPDQTGCNQLTLVVTHVSNVERFTNRISDASRAATLTWWVNINDSNDTLNDCPDPTQSVGDAGGSP